MSGEPSRGDLLRVRRLWRWAPGSLLIAAAAAAAPGATPAPAAKRKPPPEGFPAEAIEPFVDAILADKAGNLGTAQRRYQDANRISDQAATHYNIADVQRRMERWKQAIESYKKYLALAPEAPDRAEIERLIAQLQARPGTAVIDGDEPDALVFVDGKLVGPSPVVLQLPDGRHTADRITLTGHSSRSFEMKPATNEHVRASLMREEGGNVILSGNLRFSGSWRDNGNEYRLPGRIALPPGRHTTYVIAPDRTCSPLVFDAPKPDELVYVFIEAAPEPPAGAPRQRGCIPIQVRQAKVRFPP
jgi:tetratricopeptide (TPR) repeat protein